MVIFVLVVLILLELGFAWHIVKKFTGSKRALGMAMQLNSQYADRILKLEGDNKTATADLQEQCKWHQKLEEYLLSQLTEGQVAGLDENLLLEISEWVPSRAVLDANRAAKRKKMRMEF